MSGRTYLSIGDVLTLLRREFPDVTISKIRFLESQGLVDPERTPSGYRKFYEHDVERLRWVLRQQREHFLPLKVIKGRLEQETSSPSARQPNGRGLGDRAEIRSEQSSAVLVGQPRAGHVARSEESVGASLVTDLPAHRRVAGAGPSEAPGVGVQSAFPEPSPTVPAAETSSAPSGAASVLHLTKPPVTPADTDRGAARTDVAQRRSGRVEREEPPAAEETSPASAAPSVGDVASMAAFAGTSVTADELSAESGLEASEIRDLESFGLLSGRSMGGEVYYDEDALVVAKLAAAFAQYGVEARHLRLHLLAAQREAGFVEQIVLPLLKQRNPASRQRAHETVDELTRLGQEIRAVLLQRSLRELLGG